MIAPELAVVIPVYRQAMYLGDAVLSVWHQTIRDRVGVVIVNDGCPDTRTDALGRAFAAHPGGQTIYLRTTNRGLPAARNTGVRFALEGWPTVRAVFPLDADNMVEPTALERMWRRLRAAPESVGWTYTDLELFGESRGCVVMPHRFSRRRLLRANYCDAGSLIRDAVFRAGCWYDEAMRDGYEDWEFFIRATIHGFRAIHTPRAGFRYRKRAHSMVDGAVARHDELVAYIRRKHAALYATAGESADGANLPHSA